MRDTRNGDTIHTDNHGIVKVVDVDHGPVTMLVEVQQTRDRSFLTTVYVDEQRQLTHREKHALFAGRSS